MSRLIDAWRRSGATRRWRCVAGRRWPRRRSPTGSFGIGSQAIAGRLWRHEVLPQRPLWASTSTKNPAYPDTLYVDNLIGDDTVNTLPEDTIAAFEDHGTLARTVDIDADAAQQVIDDLEAVGIDLEDVGRTLETEGVDKFNASFEHLIGSLDTKAQALAAS